MPEEFRRLGWSLVRSSDDPKEPGTVLTMVGHGGRGHRRARVGGRSRSKLNLLRCCKVCVQIFIYLGQVRAR